MNILSALMSDNSGNPSSMRVAALGVVGAILGPWAYVTCHTGVVQPLSTEHVGLVLGALAAKAYQKVTEGKTDGETKKGSE